MRIAKRQLAGSGEALPAGAVGETKTINVLSNTNWVQSGVYVNLTSITLETGVWLCTLSGTFIRNSATFSMVDNALFTFSDTTAAPGYNFNAQSGNQSNVLPTSFSSFGISMAPIILRSTGSSIVWPDGVTRGTNVLQINGFLSTYTAGTPQYVLRISCVRIA